MRIAVLVLACIMVLFCGCDRTSAGAVNTGEVNTVVVNATTESVTESPISQEPAVNNDKQRIVEMFMKYGSYSNGYYNIEKYDYLSPCSFQYSFSYHPGNDVFFCRHSVMTLTSYTLNDYGSFIFQWGDLANGLFVGAHSLYDYSGNNLIATIEFEYRSNGCEVTKNTYAQLTQADINDYSQKCYECLEQALMYAQSVVNGYVGNITIH